MTERRILSRPYTFDDSKLNDVFDMIFIELGRLYRGNLLKYVELRNVKSIDTDAIVVAGETLDEDDLAFLAGLDQSLSQGDAVVFDDITISNPSNIYALSHDSFADTHNLTTDIDHDTITNNHNLTTDIDHDALTNFVADEHINWKNTSENLVTTGNGAFDNLVISGTITKSAIGAIAADGTSQGDAALTADINEIATNANNDIVTLPAASPGRQVTIINNTGNTIVVFPASGDNAEAGVDTSFNLTSAQRCILWAYDSTNWAKIIA